MKKTGRGWLRELLTIAIPGLLIAVAVQSFVFKPFRIPSESMLPTLLVGDYIYVSKFSYGFSRHSFPLSLPLFSGRIFAAEPKRGDVVVFRLPTDDSTDYVKRLVGLPGDRVQMYAGILHINGQAVTRERIADFVLVGSGIAARSAQYRETLPNGIQHPTLDLQPDGPLDETQVYRVPAGHYFMMGDNRDDSTDSRVLSEVGYVPSENLIGRAELILFSIGEGARPWEFWRWREAVRWSRIFSAVR